jgi:hypothetical protein
VKKQRDTTDHLACNLLAHCNTFVGSSRHASSINKAWQDQQRDNLELKILWHNHNEVRRPVCGLRSYIIPINFDEPVGFLLGLVHLLEAWPC